MFFDTVLYQLGKFCKFVQIIRKYGYEHRHQDGFLVTYRNIIIGFRGILAILFQIRRNQVGTKTDLGISLRGLRYITVDFQHLVADQLDTFILPHWGEMHAGQSLTRNIGDIR